jgi:hypothetical protein
VFQEDKESSGTFSFVSSMTGLYSICLSNSMSTVTAKVVNFHFHVGNALTSHQVAKKEHLTGLEIGVMSLSEGLSFLKDELDYVKTRERMHRDSTPSICLCFLVPLVWLNQPMFCQQPTKAPTLA